MCKNTMITPQYMQIAHSKHLWRHLYNRLANSFNTVLYKTLHNKIDRKSFRLFGFSHFRMWQILVSLRLKVENLIVLVPLLHHIIELKIWWWENIFNNVVYEYVIFYNLKRVFSNYTMYNPGYTPKMTKIPFHKI
jgi:hypothetical protein